LRRGVVQMNGIAGQLGEEHYEIPYAVVWGG
jgi:hypothetical protein